MSDDRISPTPSSSEKPRCIACQGRIATTLEGHCEHCQRLLLPPVAIGIDDPRPMPSFRLPESRFMEPGLFAIGMISMGFTILLVFLAPEILVTFGVLVFPVCVRTLRLRHIARQQLDPPIEAHLLAAFVASLGAVVTMVLAGVVAAMLAFASLLIGTGFGSPQADSLFAKISVPLALVVGTTLFLLLWPRQPQPFDPRPKKERDED